MINTRIQARGRRYSKSMTGPHIPRHCNYLYRALVCESQVGYTNGVVLMITLILTTRTHYHILTRYLYWMDSKCINKVNFMYKLFR